MKKKYYDAVVYVKEVLSKDKVFEETLDFYDGDIVKLIKTEAAKIESIHCKLAFLAVMFSGALREDFYGTEFLLPKTADALNAIKPVEKALKKGRKLLLCIYPWAPGAVTPDAEWLKVY